MFLDEEFIVSELDGVPSRYNIRLELKPTTNP